MPVFTIIIPVSYSCTQCCHCSSVKRAIIPVCFSYLLGVFLNTPSKLFTFPWRLLGKIQEYQWPQFMCIYGVYRVSGRKCLEGTTKYSDILKCAQWTCIRLSTNATGATVTWSTLFCLQKLVPSFAINNSAADLILSFRRIKQHIAFGVCVYD